MGGTIAARYNRLFLSTPSGWRATLNNDLYLARLVISIHALRVEGDVSRAQCRFSVAYFYPRPPGGGRPLYVQLAETIDKFLSTPSGWRATATLIVLHNYEGFLSTPSGWRATHVTW